MTSLRTSGASIPASLIFRVDDFKFIPKHKIIIFYRLVSKPRVKVAFFAEKHDNNPFSSSWNKRKPSPS